MKTITPTKTVCYAVMSDFLPTKIQVVGFCDGFVATMNAFGLYVEHRYSGIDRIIVREELV